MSYINFLLQGIEGQQEKYRREHFSNGKTKTICFDNAYKVLIVTDKIRTECRDVWNKLKNGTKITFIASVIGSLAGLVSAIALDLLLPHLPLVALAVGIVSLGIFGFSLFAFHRSKQAEKQLILWDDPTNIKKCQNLHILNKVSKAAEDIKNQYYSNIKQNNEELNTKLKGFIDQIKELEVKFPNVPASELLKALYHSGLIDSVKKTLELYKIYKMLDKISKKDA